MGDYVQYCRSRKHKRKRGHTHAKVRLHGHGWRRRYAVGLDQETRILYIHRLICPECGQTYTVIPRGLHPYLVYTIDVIFLVILFYLSTAKKNGKGQVRCHIVRKICSFVNIDVRRQWVRNYKARYKIMNTTTILPEFCVKTHYMAVPQHVEVTGNRGEIRRLRKQFRPPHHLHLLIL